MSLLLLFGGEPPYVPPPPPSFEEVDGINVCTPVRVDHLDGNTTGKWHDISPFVGDATNDQVWICYSNSVSRSTISGGVYLRTYNYVTKALGPVLTIANDNTGTDRYFPTTAKDNRWPNLVRLNDGTFVCLYAGTSGKTHTVLCRESNSPHDGTDWTAEVELEMPFPTAAPSYITYRHTWCVLATYTDGVDVFALARQVSGTAGAYTGFGTGDLVLMRRTGVNTWAYSWIVNNQNDQTLIVADYGENPAQSLWFEAVSAGVWRVAIIGKQALRASPYTGGVYCWTNPAHDATREHTGVDGSGNALAYWTRTTIHDFTGDTSSEKRRPLLKVGSDHVLRTIYFDIIGTSEKAFGATSVDFGAHWNDLGILDPAVVNLDSFWDMEFDASFSLDLLNRWVLSSCADPADDQVNYHTALTIYLTDQDDNTEWKKYFKCDIDLTSIGGASEAKSSDGPGVSYWTENRHLRLFGSTNSSTLVEKLLLLDTGIPTTLPPTCLNSQIRVCYWDTVTVCAEPDTPGHSYYWTAAAKIPPPDLVTQEAGGQFVSTDRCITFTVTRWSEGRYTVRITDDATGLWVECIHIIQGENCNPPPPPPGTIVFIERQENRLYRRGVIKVRDTGIHQGKAYTVAEVEILDKPNWGGN